VKISEATEFHRYVAGRQLNALDLCCCAGGAGKGYADAGYNVTGVDNEPQPNYPFTFVQADAIDYVREHGHEYDLIHASPPCQGESVLNAYNQIRTYPDLIGPVQDALRTTGKPYIIENVEGARRKLVDPVRLCGPTFQLLMYRHRLFEVSFDVYEPVHLRHEHLCTRNSYLPTPERPFMTITGGKHSRAWQRKACEVMGTPWMGTIREVCEAIPPPFTWYLGIMYLWYRDLEKVA
jgi:DNA (cytosine-5)-methyltransferase 1